jgi:hypothetical protein
MIMHLTTATILALLISVIIPHLTSLVSNTKIVPVWAGGYVTLFLAAVTGFCSEWAQSPNDYNWRQGLATAIGAFVVAVVSRVGVLKNTPTDTKLIDLGASRANKRGARGVRGPDRGEYEHVSDAA